LGSRKKGCEFQGGASLWMKFHSKSPFTLVSSGLLSYYLPRWASLLSMAVNARPRSRLGVPSPPPRISSVTLYRLAQAFDWVRAQWSFSTYTGRHEVGETGAQVIVHDCMKVGLFRWGYSFLMQQSRRVQFGCRKRIRNFPRTSCFLRDNL
jgi:hypothetical protein